MSEEVKESNDGVVDGIVATIIIGLVIVTVLFWISGQSI